MASRVVVLLCILSLATGCGIKPEQTILTLKVPLESFGEKTITTTVSMESEKGSTLEIIFLGDESFSFHSGYQIKVHAEGKAQGSTNDEDAIFNGNGDVNIRMTITDPVQHERVVEESYPIIVGGMLKSGKLTGELMVAE